MAPRPRTVSPGGRAGSDGLNRWEDTRLPLWLRVALYCVDHADEAGRVELRPLQLLWALDPTGLTRREHISRAIHDAKKKGALAPLSNVRRLRLSPTWGGETP